jgi:choline-sulfatase
MSALQPTNVLWLNSDEHASRVLGCYGNPVVRTPNLDALAARGTRFLNAYTNTPICVPARACLATGRYAHTINSWDNATPYVGTEAPSWGHRLSAQGHKVTTVGKLHYRKVGDPSGFDDQRLAMHVLDGVGDLYGLLRGDMPVRPQSRRQVLDAGAGEAEYTRYDRAIAQEAARWLEEEGARRRAGADGSAEKPWALFVSFTYPHFPLMVPQEFVDLYPPESVPLPIRWREHDWTQHPALVHKREQQALNEPFDEQTIRRALATYYGMVTFLDEQIGIVLRALEQSGQLENTRVVYTSDHGDMLGDHGMWWKSAMYDGAAAIPLIVAGPDVPARKAVSTPVSLVDGFPTIIEAVGAQLAPEDTDLPGASLLRLAQDDDHDRTVFSEYHAIFSTGGIFMVRDAQYKYVYYVDAPPQLFDMRADPQEIHNLADDPAYANVLKACDLKLRAICDPEEVDRRAKADQRRRVDAAGGPAAVLAGGVKIPYTPAPDAFSPARVEARERAGQART